MASASADLQALPDPARQRGTSYGVFTAGTGSQRTAEHVRQVARATRYAANCQAPCTPGALVIPNLTNATLNVPLTSAADRVHTAPQPDRFRRQQDVPRPQRLDLAELDIFNAFNSDDYTAVRSMQFGATTYLQPSTVLQGRIIRVARNEVVRLRSVRL